MLASDRAQDGLVRRLLQRMDVPPTRSRRRSEELRKLPKVSGPGFAADKVYLTPDLAKVLTAAEQQAKKMQDEYVSVEHLFLASCAATGDGGARACSASSRSTRAGS
jgi:ATP-dependent Clp protease ATP-binding subunit ClpB